MRLWLPLLAAVAGAGCSNITDAGNGIVALDVKVPAHLEVEVGDTIQLAARALDRNGDSVAADITWAVADTTVGVIPASGRFTGRGIGGTTGRVQATEGTLVSDYLTFAVLGRADSLALPAVTALTVPAGTTSSASLTAQLLGATGVALGGHRVVFVITSPAFANAAARTVQLSNGALADTVVTAADGTLSSPVTVDRMTGVSAPPTVVVEVRALRPSGAPIPGSGQAYTVSFQ